MRNTYYIIVVEKDEAVYGKIVRALAKLGCDYDIRRVGNQEELDEQLVRLAPDFVICDHSRSEWNSFAVLQQVRAFQTNLPFAVIAGGGDDDTQASLLASGADACLDHDHLFELAPALEEMMKRSREKQLQCVDEIRRSFPPMGIPARRGSRFSWGDRQAG